MAEATTFAEARLQCHMRNARFELASIHNDEENQFVLDHVKVASFWWWTGLMRTQNSECKVFNMKLFTIAMI